MKHYILLFLIASCALFSCDFQENVPQNLQRNDFAESWIAGKPCKAPCWQNIAPGITTKFDAWKIVSSSSDVTDLREQKYTPDEGVIFWEWKKTKTAANIFYKHNKVIMIDFSIAPEKVKFIDIMNMYGEPTHIAVQGGGFEGAKTIYSATVLYKNDGFSIGSAVDTSPFPIDQKMQFDHHVIFFIPSDEGMDFFRSNYPISWVPWKGFGKFSTYCNLTGVAESTICRD